MNRPMFSTAMHLLTIITVMVVLLDHLPIISGQEAIDWTKCSSPVLDEMNAQCGFVRVPLDHADPEGEKILIAISRIKSDSPTSDYQGPMLLNPGGPGIPGLNLAGFRQRIPKDISGTYDWIGFDTRGVGNSQPALRCDPSMLTSPALSHIPYTQEREDNILNFHRNYVRACAANNPKLIHHMTTVDIVKDIDLIRKALGAEKISFYGFSYGAYLGQVYATMYPASVNRMILDSNVNPTKVWYSMLKDRPKGFDRNMKLFFQWLARYNSIYNLGETECEVERRYNDVLKQLEEKPIENVFGPSEWISLFRLAATVEAMWPLLGISFSKWVNEQLPGFLPIFNQQPLELADNSGAAFLSVTCSDAPWPKNVNYMILEFWRLFAKYPGSAWTNAFYALPCLFWPAKSSTPVEVGSSDVNNILLIGATLDATTPFSGSLEVRHRFPTARLLAIIGGTTHSSTYWPNRCVDTIINRYLQSGELPPRKSSNHPDQYCLPPSEPIPLAGLRTSSLPSNDTFMKDLVIERGAFPPFKYIPTTEVKT